MPARAASDADRGDDPRAGGRSSSANRSGRKAAGLDAPSVNAKGGVRGGRCQRRPAPFARATAPRSIRTARPSASPPRRPVAARRSSSGPPRARMKFGRRTADVVLDDGTIRANRVVVATGRPTALFKSLITALLAEELVPRAHGAGAGKGPAAARAPRGRRARPGRAASRRALGGRRAAARSRAPTARRFRRGCCEKTHRAAHRSADVRAVDDLSGHLRHPAGVRLGSAVRAARPRACPTSARTATSRIICSRSATPATA